MTLLPRGRLHLALAISLLALLALPAAAQKSKKGAGWAKGVAYTTDWKKAIKEARATGKLIFIYNGWQNRNI